MKDKILARVTVTAPASTSNLGPGFDCLGMALGLRNELTLELHDASGPPVVEIEGAGADTLARGETNMLVRAARMSLPPSLPGRLVFKARNRVPLARGLGSSAAAIVTGLWAGAHLVGTLRRSEDELEQLAVGLEGHPDNIAPCVHGGLTASLVIDGRARAQRLGVHASLSSVVCIPDFELSTKKARSVLPETVFRDDAVFNASRALLLVRALESGHVARLPELMKDRLHQPYRAKLVPGLEDALAAAVDAGAAGASLSGSGPTVFAFVEGRNAAVGEAMVRAFHKHGVSSRWLSLQVDHQGVAVHR
ncbi:MAG: homoserine kinase [Elusimicrobiota bacterium]|nr:MAG: homoserine kinase [Elusimicrobiota bacterium]